MPFNVSAINNVNYKPLFFNANKYDSQKFVQNAYAVKGDLQHPESRTNYSSKDNKGMGVYYLA